ncbi:MAG: VOC family protein [Bacteroidota bacterium]
MRVKIVSIPVLDQQKALDFYTEKLGLVKKTDFPVGGGNRWLTVVTKEQPGGPEILLEPAPLHFEPSKVYQDELMKVGMPSFQFYVDSVQAEYDRLVALDVAFSMEPKDVGMAVIAIFNDTCGNNIQLVEEKAAS